MAGVGVGGTPLRDSLELGEPVRTCHGVPCRARQTRSRVIGVSYRRTPVAAAMALAMAAGTGMMLNPSRHCGPSCRAAFAGPRTGTEAA